MIAEITWIQWACAIEYFRFPKFRLSLVLVFISAEMLFLKYIHISTPLSLGVIGTIILTSIGVSLVSRRMQVNRQLKRNIGHGG